MGKRVTGHYFLDHVIDGSVEACNYLLTVDVDMNVLPGYEYATWEKGYGDFSCRPDLATLRRIPWLEATALVVCDLFDEETGEPVEVAPRTILRRQLERAAALGYTIKCRHRAGVHPVPPVLRGGGGGRLPGPHPAERLRPRLPHPPDHQGRVPHPPDPQRDGRCGRPGRVLQGRGRARPARDQPVLRRGAGDGRPPHHLQERGEGDRRPQRPGHHLHGQVRLRQGRIQLPHPLQRVGRRRASTA